MAEVVKRLRVKNFENYRDQEVTFTAGLNLLSGRNNVGKTTLLDAITYGLFGDVPGVKAGALVSRYPSVSDMKTLVEFNGTRGQQAQLLRVGMLNQKGEFKTEDKKLVVDGKQEQIEGEDDMKARVADLLGISLRKFHSLVYVRQGQMATILEPNKEQMDSLLQITLLRELRDQFDEVRKQYERYDGNDVTTLIGNIESMLGEKRNELQHVLEDAKLLEAEVADLLALIQRSESKELLELIKQVDDREQLTRDSSELSIKSAEALKAAGVTSLPELTAKLDLVSSEYAVRRAKKAEVEARMAVEMEQWAGAKGQAESVRQELAGHEQMLRDGVSKCPECGQPITPDRLQQLVQDAGPKLKVLTQRESEERSKYESDRLLAESLNDAAKYEYMISELKSQKTSYEGYQVSLNDLNRSIVALTGSISAALKSLGLTQLDPGDKNLKLKVAQNLPIGVDELNSKKSLLASRQKQLADKKVYQDSVTQWISQSEKRYTMLKARLAKASLAKSFSSQFGQAIEQRRKDIIASIEFKAFEYYKKLTDQQVYSGFTVDSEDYTVYVHPRGLTQEIPATRVGGGHQTLIALSVRLALMDVTRCKNLLLLDEPTDGVDSANMPQLAAYLGELSKFIDQIIMVTHFNICEESAANIISIVSDQNGSRVA